jgi:hypothetical protein
MQEVVEGRRVHGPAFGFVPALESHVPAKAEALSSRRRLNARIDVHKIDTSRDSCRRRISLHRLKYLLAPVPKRSGYHCRFPKDQKQKEDRRSTK